MPVFTCIVYIASEGGSVRARVANLEGGDSEPLAFTAPGQREALAKLIPAFKQRIVQLRASGEHIPWRDPPAPREANERELLIPVHL